MEARLKLKPSKCELFWWQIAYLGHIVSAQGIATDKGKVEVIQMWLVLTKVTEVQSFLEFTGYYWRFIPKVCTGSLTPAWVKLWWECWQEKATIRWNNRCQWAFDHLKTLCTTVPIFVYADFTQPFKHHTDACRSGLGAILYQTHGDGMDAVIAYASRSLTKAESHYLAINWNFSPLSGL